MCCRFPNIQSDIPSVHKRNICIFYAFFLTFFFLQLRNILVQDSSTVQNLPLFSLSIYTQNSPNSSFLKSPFLDLIAVTFYLYTLANKSSPLHSCSLKTCMGNAIAWSGPDWRAASYNNFFLYLALRQLQNAVVQLHLDRLGKLDRGVLSSCIKTAY